MSELANRAKELGFAIVEAKGTRGRGRRGREKRKSNKSEKKEGNSSIYNTPTTF